MRGSSPQTLKNSKPCSLWLSHIDACWLLMTKEMATNKLINPVECFPVHGLLLIIETSATIFWMTASFILFYTTALCSRSIFRTPFSKALLNEGVNPVSPPTKDFSISQCWGRADKLCLKKLYSLSMFYPLIYWQYGGDKGSKFCSIMYVINDIILDSKCEGFLSKIITSALADLIKAR